MTEPEKTRTTVYLPKKERDAARKLLARRDQTLSSFFRACVRFLLGKGANPFES